MNRIDSNDQSSHAPNLSSQRLVIAVTVGLFAFVMYLWQLTVPQFIAFYDSGVYLAASLHFVSGVLPYKDFTFVNPPGILLLMSPIALFSRVFGSHDGFILARVITSFVTAVNVSLLAWLVRYRGRIAMAIAGVGLAVLPVAFFVSSDLKLDPYCICFILIGAVVIFSKDQGSGRISKRTFAIGGLFFGIAALIKLWAFFPFLAVVIVFVPRCKGRVLAFASGAACGFIVPSLPFFLASPRGFVSQVFTAQLFQKMNPAVSPGILWRLVDMTGFSDTSIAPTGSELVITLFVLICLVIVAYWRRLNRESVDIFLLIAALITAFALLAAPVSAEYYGYFAAPFLVGVFAISLARLGGPVRRIADRITVSSTIRSFATWSTAVAGIALWFALTLYVTTFYTNYAWFNGVNPPYLSSINKTIPAGSCVVYDYAIYGIYSNRLQTSVPNCPSVVDAYGMWQTFGNHLASAPPEFVSEWKSYFERAQYVVLNRPNTDYVPWNDSLTSWFANHYHLIAHGTYVYIYQNES